MMLVTQSEAAKYPNAPPKSYLYIECNKANPPAYFVLDDGYWKIDISHPEWCELLEFRKNKEKKKTSKKAPEISLLDIKDPETKAKMEQLHIESAMAKLRDPILKAENLSYKIEQEKLKLEKEAGNLIDFELAEYLFFGYIERANTEILRLTHKIKPIIINLCNENKPEAIIKRFNRELEAILIEIKDSQKIDVKQWRADR